MRLKPTEDVRPIPDFRNHAAEILAQVKATKRFVIIRGHDRNDSLTIMQAEY